MRPESLIQRTFAAGELAPVLHARADNEKYLSGLKTCRNFIVMRGGGVQNRSGFRFVAACKTTDQNVKLMRYVSELAGESILIEAGEGYLRFFKDGAAIESSPGVPFEIATPFVSADICNWVQSGNVITLTHRDDVPQELIFDGPGLTDWTLQPIVTESSVPAPANLVVTPAGAGARTIAYLVTAAAEDTYEESPASNIVVTTSTAEPTADDPDVLEWDPVVGAAEYYIYADYEGNGTFGFLGTATGAEEFRNTGFIPDYTVTPPAQRSLFASSGNYPHVAGHYQQRRFFSGSRNEPEVIYGSRTGFPSNFGISSPLQDDDSLTFRMVGDQHHPVRSILGLKTMIVLTDGAGWTIGQPKVPLTPSNIPADEEYSVGANGLRPVKIGNSILYVQARESIVRDLRFDINVGGLEGRDLTVFASHLFEGHSIDRIDYAQAPDSIMWVVRDDGVLLGLTYLREQEVWGWHRHDTQANGRFEDVCVVPESLEDAVYVIVRRTIEGGFVRYIERMAPRKIVDFDTECFFVDSGLSYSGAPADTFAGLDHLEGEVVAVVGDGEVVYNGDPNGADAATYTVTGGEITLPAEYSEVHIGLQIANAEIETLDLDVAGSSVRDKLKRVGAVTLLVDKSSRSFYAGPSDDDLLQYLPEPHEDDDADEFTGQLEMAVKAGYGPYGRVLVRQTDPLPLTILGILPNTLLGG